MWKISFIIRISGRFDERVIIISVPFLIPYFNLFSCEADNFIFTCYIESFYSNIILKPNKIIIL